MFNSYEIFITREKKILAFGGFLGGLLNCIEVGRLLPKCWCQPQKVVFRKEDADGLEEPVTVNETTNIFVCRGVKKRPFSKATRLNQSVRRKRANDQFHSIFVQFQSHTVYHIILVQQIHLRFFLCRT